MKRIFKKGSKLDLTYEFFIRGLEDSFKEAGFWSDLGAGAKSVWHDIGSSIKSNKAALGQAFKEHPVGYTVGRLAPGVGLTAAGLYGTKKLVEHWGRKGAQKELANKQK
jgi:hypothetical protein